MTSVLVLGGTGHLGAPLLTALRNAYPSLPMTAYLRSSTSPSAKDVSKLNISIAEGVFSETDEVSNVASQHSIIINAADSTDVPLTQAIIAGLARRKAETGKQGILLHISGVGNFLDEGTTGSFNPESKVWNDASEDDMRAIHAEMKNGACDEVILKASEKGDMMSYIVCAPGIHGKGESQIGTSSLGVLVKNILLKNVLSLGYVPYVGEGSSVFMTMHVQDVITFTLKIFDQALQTLSSPPATFNPYAKFYVPAGPTQSWLDITTPLAKKLHQLGYLSSSEPKSVPMDKAGFVGFLLAANLLVKGDRAAKIDWEMKHGGIEESIERLTREDVEGVIGETPGVEKGVAERAAEIWGNKTKAA